jgi:hypothetical protein
MKKNARILFAIFCFLIPFGVTVYVHEVHIDHCVKQIKKERAEGKLKDHHLLVN